MPIGARGAVFYSRTFWSVRGSVALPVAPTMPMYLKSFSARGERVGINRTALLALAVLMLGLAIRRGFR